MKLLLASAWIGAGLLVATPAGAVPVLTLSEHNGQFIDWSWSDGSGSGTFNSTSSDEWKNLEFVLPLAVAEDFWGMWEEDFPNQRNHVFITPKRDPSGAIVPNVGIFNANSDWPHSGGGLTPLGSPISSYTGGLYQVIFNDGPDHVLSVSDGGSMGLMLCASLGSVALVRRRKVG